MSDSSKIRVLIVDDEMPARTIIRSYLDHFPDIEILGECANGFEAMKTIRELNPDFIFLDIQMPKVNGLELLEVLENAPYVIFTTAYDEYALKAFELNAVDYLLKPFSRERFIQAVDKVLDKIRKGEPNDNLIHQKIRAENAELLNRIVVKKGSSMSVIPVQEVLFLEAQEDYVMVHTTQGRFMKNQTMHYFESHLPDDYFVRIHRSYLANVEMITRLEPYDKDSYLAIIPPDHKLRISRAGYKKLKERLGF